jgi:predicted RNA polymerase sigma factor
MTAEDLAQDALVAALEQWPASGIAIGAWRTAAAKRRDRPFPPEQTARAQARGAQLAIETGQDDAPDLEPPWTTTGDDLLRLIFTACHPVLSTEPGRPAARRAHDGGNRPRVSRRGANHRAKIVRAKRTCREA